MIDKLLALAAVEQQGWLQNAAPVSIPALVADVAGQLRTTARGHGVDLAIGDVAAGAEVTGDPFLLRQALHNLVDNAIAFSPAGTCVEISARNADGAVVIVVGDRGPGVPAYARERVFERFYSLPRPGSGLRSWDWDSRSLPKSRPCIAARSGWSIARAEVPSRSCRSPAADRALHGRFTVRTSTPHVAAAGLLPNPLWSRSCACR